MAATTTSGNDGMGEAKRKNQQQQQAARALRDRVKAGAFGAPGQVREVCFVVDKSAPGRETLALLRTLPEFAALAPRLDDEALRVWDLAAVFPYALIGQGGEWPDGRSFVAATLDKLTQDVLPRALRQFKGPSPSIGCVVGVDPAVQAEVQAVVDRFQS